MAKVVRSETHPDVSSGNIRMQAIITGIGVILFFMKLTAWYITGSNSILTDALESLVNITAGGVGLYSLYLASLPRDENHPYGHGKIEFISASIEGSLIFVAGGIIALKAGYNFFFPLQLQSLDTGIILIASAGLVNYTMGFILQKRGEKVHSLTMVAGGKHLKSDGWSTLGLLAGLTAILITDITWIDNVVTIIFGAYIVFTGIQILKKSVSGIMDEMDFDLLKPLTDKLNLLRREKWIDVHNLRVIKYGTMLHVDCHITVPWYLNVQEAHAEVFGIEDEISDLQGRPVEWFIHVDPCHEGSCRFCTIANCEVRKHPFEKRIEWDQVSLTTNKNHGEY